jgi:hypothetical protein
MEISKHLTCNLSMDDYGWWFSFVDSSCRKLQPDFPVPFCMQILAELEPFVKVPFVMLELGGELEEAKRPTKTKFGHIHTQVL